MTLQKFPLLQDNTRLIKFKDTLYKVKIKYRLDTFEGRKVTFSQVEAHDEIEQTFRAVLYLNERNQNLKTIATPNFLIQPYKFPWSFPRKCCDYSFQQNGESLKVFDHVFELHVTNKKAEKYISENEHSGSKRVNDCNTSNYGTKTDKEAVIIVTDINSDTNTRFGRRNDGQLFRVFANKTVPGQTNTLAKGGELLVYQHQQKKGHESPKKSRSHTSQQVETKNEEKAVEIRTNNILNTSHLHGKSEGRKSQSQKKADGHKKDDGTHMSEGKRNETIIPKLHTPRDKFSLRLSELRELKRENVQAQRLRGRKEKKSDQKDGTREVKHNQKVGTREVKHNQKDGTREVKHNQKVGTREVEHNSNKPTRRNESKSRLNEEMNNTVTIQRGRLTRSKHKNKGLEAVRKAKKNVQTNSAIHSAKQQNGTKKLTRNGLKEGMHVKKIKRTGQLRGTRQGSSRTGTDISSQSDLDSLYQSNYNDTVKRLSTKIRRSKQSKVKNLDQIESEQDEPISSESEIEPRKKSQRNSKRYDMAKLKHSYVTVSNREKNDAVERHSQMFVTKNALEKGTDIELTKSPRKTRPDLKRKFESTSEPRRVSRSGYSQKDDSSSSSDTERRKGSSHKAESSSLTSDTEKRSPRKSRRLEQRREGYTSDETQSGRSQDSAMSRKTKLYASRNSPQIVVDLECKRVVEISSPRVSTVLPVKRSHVDVMSGQRSQPGVSSPSSQRITRQSLHDEELRRIQGLREERPTQIYRDIMLAQGRDRYMVEQAESMETDKLRQLYEPTVPSHVQRFTEKKATKRRRSSGLWGKIMDNLVTPTKKYIVGKK